MVSGLAFTQWPRTLYTMRRAARCNMRTACPVTPTSAMSAVPTAAAARLAAVDAQLAALQAERAVLQAAVFAETFPAWARARAAAAAETGYFRLDGDADLRGFADVLAAHMVAPPTVTCYEMTGKYYDPAWQYADVEYSWDGVSILVSQARNFCHPDVYLTTPRDNDFEAQLRDWNDARKESREAKLELRDVPEHFWLALVEEELR